MEKLLAVVTEEANSPEKLLSASQIAALHLSSLPTSKAGILALARREGWYSEVETGLGGQRHVFEVPTKYIDGRRTGAGNFFSAGELATMHLQLPEGREAIAELADREQWPYEDVPGLRGKRRVYRVPEKYLPPPAPNLVDVHAALPKQPTAPTIAAGAKANPELLALAVQAVEEWCQETGRTLSPGRKGSVIAVLYDYLAKGGGETEVRALLQAVG